MDELSDLIFSGVSSTNKRALKIFDILDNRGFDSASVSESIQYGDGSLPDKFKTGGTVSRKKGGTVSRNTGGRPDYGLDKGRRARIAQGFKVKGSMKKAMDKKLGTWRAKKAGKKGIRGVKSGGKIMQGYKAGAKV